MKRERKKKQVRGVVRRFTLLGGEGEEIYCSKLLQAVSARLPIARYAR